jgi:multidrug transporter EmrE-like cation transporter
MIMIDQKIIDRAARMFCSLTGMANAPSKTERKAYSGLVPMSPYTTPRAAIVSADLEVFEADMARKCSKMRDNARTMNAYSFGLVLTGVVLNALAQSLLKLGTNRVGELSFSLRDAVDTATRILTQWPFLLGFAAYGISLVVWIAALTRVPVTVAYPMLSIGYVINALIARYWLGETMSLGGWSGIALIAIGVWLIARQTA